MNKLFAATAAVLLSAGAFAQTVDEIVDKHIAALGGLDKIKSVSTVVTEQALSIQGMEIPVKSIIVVGKSLRTESSVMGNTMLTVIDGTTGWMVRPAMMGGTGEPEDMPADQIKQQAGQLDPFGALVGYKEKGNNIELVGKEKLDKADVYHLKITTKSGNVVDEYIDATTFMISKLKASANGQDSEILFSDYKAIDGVKFAHTMEMASQMGALSFTVNKITLNGKVDDAIFKKPAK
ncbi:MAG: outer membrane lipoprotein-sorting protein [Spirosomataceae bacterium]